MKSFLGAAILAIGHLAAAVPGGPDVLPSQNLKPRQVPVRPCSTRVHVIAAGGRGTPNPYEYGLLGSLASSILAAIPDSTNVSLPYDKLNTITNPYAIPDGVNTLVQYINDYHNACPNTKQVLIGYSSGAIITMNALCEGAVDQGLAGGVISSTVVYGDQTRVAGQAYNLGTCTANSGRSPRDPAGCGAFAANMQNVCNWNDPECCVPGYDPEVHFVYDEQYDGSATQFVVDKFHGA